MITVRKRLQVSTFFGSQPIATGSTLTPSMFVNFSDVHQTIDGLGAANSPQGLDATKADLFFTTAGGGIGLSLMRLPFASNGPGPSPYFPETTTFYNDVALVAARGIPIWAAPWTAMNTTWKDNGSLVQGHLLAGHFGDYASFLAGLQADLVTNSSGTTLYGMSICNEPDIADGGVSYESMQMSAADMTTIIKNNIGPTFAGLTPIPKIIGPECESWDNSASYAATILADTTAAGYIDIIATHQYLGTVGPISTTKKVWQTEMSDIGGVFDASISNGLTLAARVHSALTVGNVNAWHAWWMRGSQANNLAIIGNSGDDTITKRFYCYGNYTKFIRPGMVRCGVTGTVSGVSISAFKNASTGDFSIVAINTNVVPTVIALGLSGLTINTHNPWVTSATQNLESQPTQSVTRNVLSYTLVPLSVTTFQGTGS